MLYLQVRHVQADPMALSYWLASNLPLEDDTRQRLLEAPTVVERYEPFLTVMQLCGCFMPHECAMFTCCLPY